MQKPKASKRLVIPKRKLCKGILCVPNGSKCITGYMCAASGVKNQDMQGRFMPNEVCEARWASTQWARDLITINDCEEGGARFRKLAALGKKHGWTFVFTSKAKPKSKKTSKSTGKGTRTRKSSY